MLIAVCVLSPDHLEHVLGFTSFRLRFGGVLRGRFVPRTCFDRVPAGTVLAGTRLYRIRSDYKKWCVPRTCSEKMFPWNCTENKCELRDVSRGNLCDTMRHRKHYHRQYCIDFVNSESVFHVMDERDPNRRPRGHTTLRWSSKLELLALTYILEPSCHDWYAQGGTVN